MDPCGVASSSISRGANGIGTPVESGIEPEVEPEMEGVLLIGGGGGGVRAVTCELLLCNELGLDQLVPL